MLTNLLGTKSLFIATAAAAMLVPLLGAAQATVAGKPKGVQLLFVQTAKSAQIDAKGQTLTLKGLSPTTLYFSDRPARIAGHYRNEEYMRFWKSGADSFLNDPPNATLSAFEPRKDDLADVVVTLRNARLQGDQITYDIKVINGTLPKVAAPVTLFIDIIGMPWTPLSVAGVERRAAYRTVMWGAAATSVAAASEAAAYEARPTTVNITETPAAPPAAPAAPALSSSQTSAVARLKELKGLLNQGLITQAQYQQESQKLLNQIAE